MKTCFIVFVLIWCALQGDAQSVLDTTSNLDSIVVLAKAVTPLGQPAKISRRDWQAGKLSSRPEEALLYLPGVHIRQRGPGQVATLQYRGLQGARIAQTWQGIPVTNPQIGTGDANELTLALVDQVAIGSPSTIGNGAAITSSQTAGGQTSLTTRYANGKGYFINGQWKGLRLLYQHDSHDFKHSSGGVDFVSKPPGAKTKTLGASFTKLIGDDWSTSTYFIQSDRTIREEFDDFEIHVPETRLKTTTARQLFTWLPDSSMRFDFGVLYDAQEFVGPSQLSSKGSTFQTLAQSQFLLWPSVRLTTDNRLVYSENSEYTKDVLLPETRTLLNYTRERSGLKFDVTSGVHARINSGVIFFGNATLSKEFTTTEHAQVSARRIGRIPSLDDQLWRRGGSEELGTEKGWEINTSSQGRIGQVVLTPLAFVRRFSSYILWLPNGSIWTPNNISAVNNYGAGLDIATRVGSNASYLKVLGSFNYSVLRIAEDQVLQSGVILKADENLPFAPSVTGSMTLDYVHEHWSSLVQGRYTGNQVTAFNGLSDADEHVVLRAAVSHQLFNSLAVTVSCDNLTNTIIPNDFGLYSPLRRFELSLNYTPKK